MTVELIQGLLLAFFLVVILMPSYIRFLRVLGMGKRIRRDGPESHLVKEGVPTMGGLLLIVIVLGHVLPVPGLSRARASLPRLRPLLLVAAWGPLTTT